MSETIITPPTELSVEELAVVIVDHHAAQVQAENQALVFAALWADRHTPPVEEAEPATGRFAPLVERWSVYGGDGTPPVAEWCCAEYGRFVGVGMIAARAVIADALDLRHRLPLTWRRVVDGQVRAWKARKIADATRDLDRAAAGVVDRAICGFIETLPWPRFEQTLGAAVREADPALAAERAAVAKARRGVWATRSEDGLRTLVAKAVSGDVVVFMATVNRIADILAVEAETAGRPAEPVDARRAGAIGILAQPAKALALLLAHAGDADPGPTDPGPHGPERPPAPANTDDPLWSGQCHDDLFDAKASVQAQCPGPLAALVVQGESSRCRSLSLSKGQPAAPRPLVPDDLEPDPPEPPTPIPPEDSPPPDAYAEPPQDPQLDPPDDPPDRSGPADGGLWLPATAPAVLDALIRKLQPVVNLNYHLSDWTVNLGYGDARSEHDHADPTSLPALHDWLATTGCRVTVRPTFYPADEPAIDRYEIPHRMRRALLLRNPVDVFPHAGWSRRVDLDHTRSYVPDGPPGQTGLDKLGPLNRRHHRLATFSSWRKRQPQPGLYLWRSPHGWVSIVTNQGTLDLGFGRYAQAAWRAAAPD